MTNANYVDSQLGESQRRLHEKLRRELGDVILKALDDPAVVEVMLNPDGQLWEDRHGEGMKPIGSMTQARAINLIGTVAGMLGLEAKRETPIIEGELPLDGNRFEGIIPPIVQFPAFAIRKKPTVIYTLDDYVRSGVMTEAQRETLDAQILANKNILVVGSTGSGKTTFCNAVLHRIAELFPTTRVLIIEDTRELQCPCPNKVELRTSEFADQTLLLRAVLRMRPDRIVVGEVRDRSALALVKCWGTGHPGGVATVHANDAAGGLVRIEQLVQEAGVVPIPAVIADAINCIVSIQRTAAGRRIEEICLVQPGTEGRYSVTYA